MQLRYNFGHMESTQSKWLVRCECFNWPQFVIKIQSVIKILPEWVGFTSSRTTVLGSFGTVVSAVLSCASVWVGFTSSGTTVLGSFGTASAVATRASVIWSRQAWWAIWLLCVPFWNSRRAEIDNPRSWRLLKRNHTWTVDHKIDAQFWHKSFKLQKASIRCNNEGQDSFCKQKRTAQWLAPSMTTVLHCTVTTLSLAGRGYLGRWTAVLID